MKAEGAGGVVVVYSNVVALTSGIPEGLISLAVGLVGVALSRWVFVNREHRRLGRRERWTETLPVTLVAMLVVAVLVYDRDLGLSAAAFTGLGVGWAAVVLLDIFGERVIATLRGNLQAGPANPLFPSHADLSGHDGKLDAKVAETPSDMLDTLGEIDSKEAGK